jgi:3-isopropylmalate dehydratase small subunit
LSSEGRVWLFGDDVNTDLIIPGRYLDRYDPKHLAAHAMEGVSKEFAKQVMKGDIVVAGRNFGCGSSREQAVIALKEAGVSAVIARSFARIFYRNAINLGLPAVVSQDAAEVFSEGDKAVVDLSSATLVKAGGGAKARLDPIPAKPKEILDHGGLVPHVRARLRAGGGPS